MMFEHYFKSLFMNKANIIIPFLIFVITFLFHKFIIYPVEAYVFLPENVVHASYLYLPHAVRIIAYYVLGPIALIPIFLSQCFTFILFNNGELFNTVYLSTISTISIYFGFISYELIKKDNLFNINNTVDWKKIIIIGFLVSVFNSTFSTFYLNLEKSDNYFYETLNFTYLIGDVLGLVFGMILFILSMKFYGRWRSNFGNQN
jgi:hypothetical protein